ncbi:MAG TPA: hypothetical protein VGM36_05705 [Rhizomicrobium sp.]
MSDLAREECASGGVENHPIGTECVVSRADHSVMAGAGRDHHRPPVEAEREGHCCEKQELLARSFGHGESVPENS